MLVLNSLQVKSNQIHNFSAVTVLNLPFPVKFRLCREILCNFSAPSIDYGYKVSIAITIDLSLYDLCPMAVVQKHYKALAYDLYPTAIVHRQRSKPMTYGYCP